MGRKNLVEEATKANDFEGKENRWYEALDNLVEEKIIKSDFVSGKRNGYEMYELLSEHPKLILDKYNNDKKRKKFGLKRVIVDFIQWLGDHNFEDMLEEYKKRVRY